MKLATFVLAAAALAGGQILAETAPPQSLELMPMPAQVELGSDVLSIESDFTVSIEGDGATARLRHGVQRMLRRLSDRSGLFFEPATFTALEDRDGAAMRVVAKRSGELLLGEDESYLLSVSAEGVRLESETDLGALRGLETFLQLVVLDSRGVVVPAATIVDAPRFPWRGLMIDSSRHFMPVEVLKRNLDGMAAVKLNVLHWHLADDQGFRVECQSFPKLHELGSDGQFYSQNQIREVQDYAARLGIRVVPEFDLPGHATAWLVGYPELGSQPGPYEIERGWGIFKPTIDPTREETYRFLDRFVGEMAGLFGDEFMHIGGDENTGEHWNQNPDIRAFMEKRDFADTHALQQHFTLRMHQILEKHGKRMVGWDEILQPKMPTSIVIQSWRGRESLYAAARQGYSGILSNGYYIDLIQPTDFHYLNDPLPDDAPITAEERRRVLGGEATMWAEYVTPETVDSRIWPRTAAIAERLWSPGQVRDVEDMYRRLDRISLRLEEHGLQHEKNQQMMLRRLCGCRDVAALEVFLGAIEPVKIYRRGSLRKYTSFSPLTRAVDAARPDSAPARKLRWQIDGLIAGGFSDDQALDSVRYLLRQWQENHTALQEVFRTSPALREMEPLSADLAEVASLGLQALEMSISGQQAPADWLPPRLETLEAAREPRGEAELMIVDPVQRLVCAAAGVTDPEDTTCWPSAGESVGGAYD